VLLQKLFPPPVAFEHASQVCASVLQNGSRGACFEISQSAVTIHSTHLPLPVVEQNCRLPSPQSAHSSLGTTASLQALHSLVAFSQYGFSATWQSKLLVHALIQTPALQTKRSEPQSALVVQEVPGGGGGLGVTAGGGGLGFSVTGGGGGGEGRTGVPAGGGGLGTTGGGGGEGGGMGVPSGGGGGLGFTMTGGGGLGFTITGGGGGEGAGPTSGGGGLGLTIIGGGGEGAGPISGGGGLGLTTTGGGGLGFTFGGGGRALGGGGEAGGSASVSQRPFTSLQVSPEGQENAVHEQEPVTVLQTGSLKSLEAQKSSPM